MKVQIILAVLSLTALLHNCHGILSVSSFECDGQDDCSLLNCTADVQHEGNLTISFDILGRCYMQPDVSVSVSSETDNGGIQRVTATVPVGCFRIVNNLGATIVTPFPNMMIEQIRVVLNSSDAEFINEELLVREVNATDFTSVTDGRSFRDDICVTATEEIMTTVTEMMTTTDAASTPMKTTKATALMAAVTVILLALL